MNKGQQNGANPELEQATAWDDAALEPVEEQVTLFSVTIPAPLLDWRTFLRASSGLERLYWAAPAGARRWARLAGSGVAAQLRVLPGVDGLAAERDLYTAIQNEAVTLFEGAQMYAAEESDARPHRQDEMTTVPGAPRLFGGFAFQMEFVPDNTWSAYHPAQFILPHFLLTETEDGTWLTIHATDHFGQDPADVAGELLAALRARYAMLTGSVAGREQPARDKGIMGPAIRYPLSKPDWTTLVNRAMDEIAAGSLQKVVLARMAEVRQESPIDPLEALNYLHVAYPTCYRFLFEPVPGHAFFGASPELLVAKDGDEIETMALAGSIARGTTAAEDAALASALLASPKDGREHALVVDAIRSRLAPLVAEMSQPQRPTLLRFHNIQHLHTPIRATLPPKSALSTLDLVRALHPTPALGGTPREQALQFLVDAEPAPRGWYAGPVGWIDAALDGEFTVAIRSAVAQHNRAWLYAGAGIVADSDPDSEWRETNLKFRPMLEALHAPVEAHHG